MFVGLKEDFIRSWNEVQSLVHETATSHGFWDYHAKVPDKVALAEKIALIHSELSEGLEALRNTPGGFGNLGEELADAVIRIMDVSGHFDLKVAEEILAKMQVNAARAYKHGKEF